MEQENVANVLPTIHTLDILRSDGMILLQNNKSYVWKGFSHAIML